MKWYLVGTTLAKADRITSMYETCIPRGYIMRNPHIIKRSLVITKKPYKPSSPSENFGIISKKIYILHSKYIPGNVGQSKCKLLATSRRLAHKIEIGEAKRLKIEIISL
jgi:hypothetical protein